VLARPVSEQLRKDTDEAVHLMQAHPVVHKAPEPKQSPYFANVVDDSVPQLIPVQEKTLPVNRFWEDKLRNELAGAIRTPIQRAPKQVKATPTPSPGEPQESLPSLQQSEAWKRVQSSIRSECSVIENRVAMMEKMLDERFATTASEVAQTTMSLCTAMEDRCSQMVEALREDLQREMSDTVGEKVGHFMLMFAPKGTSLNVPVAMPAESPPPVVQSRNACGSDAQVGMVVEEDDSAALLPVTSPSISGELKRNAEVDSMVCMVMDRVVERVKEDECLRKVTDQYEQVKLALDELLGKIGTFEGCAPAPASSSGSIELFNMMKATALDVRRLRQQRNRDYSEAAARFEGIERVVGSEVQDYDLAVTDGADEEMALEGDRVDWCRDAPIFENAILETGDGDWQTFDETQAEPQYTSYNVEETDEPDPSWSEHAPGVRD